MNLADNMDGMNNAGRGSGRKEGREGVGVRRKGVGERMGVGGTGSLGEVLHKPAQITWMLSAVEDGSETYSTSNQFSSIGDLLCEYSNCVHSITVFNRILGIAL